MQWAVDSVQAGRAPRPGRAPNCEVPKYVLLLMRWSVRSPAWSLHAQSTLPFTVKTRWKFTRWEFEVYWNFLFPSAMSNRHIHNMRDRACQGPTTLLGPAFLTPNLYCNGWTCRVGGRGNLRLPCSQCFISTDSARNPAV